MLSGTGPIHLELHPMKINPLEEEAQRSMGKVTGHLAGCDVDHELGFLARNENVIFLGPPSCSNGQAGRVQNDQVRTTSSRSVGTGSSPFH